MEVFLLTLWTLLLLCFKYRIFSHIPFLLPLTNIIRWAHNLLCKFPLAEIFAVTKSINLTCKKFIILFLLYLFLVFHESIHLLNNSQWLYKIYQNSHWNLIFLIYLDALIASVFHFHSLFSWSHIEDFSQLFSFQNLSLIFLRRN